MCSSGVLELYVIYLWKYFYPFGHILQKQKMQYKLC